MQAQTVCETDETSFASFDCNEQSNSRVDLLLRYSLPEQICGSVWVHTIVSSHDRYSIRFPPLLNDARLQQPPC